MKRFFLALLIFFSFTLSFADFYDGSLSRFVEFDLTSTTTRGIERYNTLYSVQTGFDSAWFDGIVGVQGYENAFDCTIATEVWFPFSSWQFETSRIALGFGGLYHFQRYKDISREHDYCADTCFRYQTKRGTSITFRGGYSAKVTRLDALSGAVSRIHDHYPQATFLVDKMFENGLEVYFSHATHDLYRYPVFCSPSYTLGMAVNLDSGLRFGGETVIRIVDQYTTAPYFDSVLFRMTARYSF